MTDARTVVPLLAAFALAACSRGADTNTMAPESQAAPASQPVEATPQKTTISEAELQANDRDLQRIEAISGEIDAEARAYLQTVQAAQQAVDDLSVAAVDHHVPPRRLDAMVTRAIQDGKMEPDRRFGKDEAAQDEVRRNLETLQAFAETAKGAQDDVNRHHEAIARLRAEAHDLWTEIQDRSEATTPPGAELHPEVQEDLDKGRQLVADIDTKATTADQELKESLDRERALAAALGIDVGEQESDTDENAGAASKAASSKSSKKSHGAHMSAASAVGKAKQSSAPSADGKHEGSDGTPPGSSERPAGSQSRGAAAQK